jgi:WD40-like Beta Propeller Repeat
VIAALVVSAAVSIGAGPGVPATVSMRILPLEPDEGVFAYARISPNGRVLAYASETRHPDDPQRLVQTIRIVDLATRKLLFSEPGIDAYWSPDGTRVIFQSLKDRARNVSIWHTDGRLTRGVVPPVLGDYFSWGSSGGTDTILTIKSLYFPLNGDSGVLPAKTVPACPGIGVGDRPLISRDGQHITTFVRGTIVVRSLASCDDIVATQIRGAKADFSGDGRYIAFHAPKPSGDGYEIVVVDLQKRTQRRLTGMQGSSLFPSWTQDGRVAFRYDAPDYRGFLMVSNVLSLPEEPLPASEPSPLLGRWNELASNMPPPGRWTLLLIWSTWSAHSSMALDALQQARRDFERRGLDVSVLSAVELSSRASDVTRLTTRGHVSLPIVRLDPRRLLSTEAMNQIPATLLFDGDSLVGRRLGAQEAHELRDWVLTTIEERGGILPQRPHLQ